MAAWSGCCAWRGTLESGTGREKAMSMDSRRRAFGWISIPLFLVLLFGNARVFGDPAPTIRVGVLGADGKLISTVGFV